MLVSLLLSGFGIQRERPVLIVMGGLLAIPSAFYVGASVGSWLAMITLPLLHMAAAVAVWRRKRIFAMLSLVPNALVALWLGLVTLQNLSR